MENKKKGSKNIKNKKSLDNKKKKTSTKSKNVTKNSVKKTVKKTTKPKTTKRTPKKSKTKKQEEVVNPFKSERGFLSENETLKNYKSSSQIKKNILKKSRINITDNVTFIIILLIIGALFITVSSYINKDDTKIKSATKPIEIVEHTYVSPFSFKANLVTDEKKLEDMVKTNGRIFKYIDIVKNRSSVDISDSEKLKIVSYMLFYAKNDELNSHATSNSDGTRYEIPIAYLDPYVKSMFEGDVNYKALGIDTTYIFDNSIFFNEPYVSIVKKEYDKSIKKNVIQFKIEDLSTGSTSYLTLYYLLDGKDYKIWAIKLS